MHAKLRKKQYSMANNQEKSKELIIFYKKNNILYLFLRNLGFFATFAGKVQYKYEAQYRYHDHLLYPYPGRLRYDAEYSSWHPDPGLSSLLLLQHHQSSDELSGCHSGLRTQPTTQGKQSICSRRV